MRIPAERQSNEIAKRVKDGAQYLGYGMNIETRQVDQATRTILFVASTSAVDRYGDTIHQDGWDMKAYLRNPVILFGHDSRSLPIGRAPKTFVKDGKLHSLVEFATKDQYPFADTVFQMAAGGFLNTMSVGFIPLEYEYIIAPTEEGEEPSPWPKIEGAELSKVRVTRSSVVPVPANPEALVVGRDFEGRVPSYQSVEREIVTADGLTTAIKMEHAYFALNGDTRSFVRQREPCGHQGSGRRSLRTR